MNSPEPARRPRVHGFRWFSGAIEDLDHESICVAPKIITPGTPDEVIAAVLASTPASLVVAGHTHMQFDRVVAGRRMVNAGSVGMPYARRPGAYWVLIGPDVELRRTTNDFRAAAESVRRTQYPEREDFAKHLVRPLVPEEAIPTFERMAGRAWCRHGQPPQAPESAGRAIPVSCSNAGGKQWDATAFSGTQRIRVAGS